jgi:Animal haem peroxidase
MTGHGGVEVRGLGAPRSPLFEGRFGRMFRNLPALDPGIDAINALVKLMREAGQAGSGDNATIPAGYTYFGQFVDHDITFDPLSVLQKANDPEALVDFRTPRFDLDSLYGGGPADAPYLYEFHSPSNRGVKLLVGHNDEAKGFERDDLQRNQQGRALIGDPRNDENLIVSQMQLLFIRFHAKVVDRVRKATELEGADLFAEAQRLVRWHYQWIVTHDFLDRVAGRPAREAAFAARRFYTWENEPFMPVEYSGAAYRFGHSMVRAAYDLNEAIQDIPLFADADKPDPLEHLGGFRRLPALWSVDWSFFFKTSSRKPQLSRKIDTRLSMPLFKLPSGLDSGRHALAQLNLRRGRALGLPSGQDVAGAIGVAPMAGADLGLDAIDLPAAGKAKLKAATPLWYYVLREAEAGGGERLGAVGGTIVAEVLVGLLQGDPLSYVNQRPAWKPELPSATAGDFTMADLVKFTLG